MHCLLFKSKLRQSLSQSPTSPLPANHHYDRLIEFIPRGIPGRCTITSQRVHLGPRLKSQPQLLTCHHCLPPRSNPLQGVLLDPLPKGLQNLSHPMSSAGPTPSNPLPVLCSTPMTHPRGQPEGCPENIHPAPGGLSSPPIALRVQIPTVACRVLAPAHPLPHHPLPQPHWPLSWSTEFYTQLISAPRPLRWLVAKLFSQTQASPPSLPYGEVPSLTLSSHTLSD